MQWVTSVNHAQIVENQNIADVIVMGLNLGWQKPED